MYEHVSVSGILGGPAPLVGLWPIWYSSPSWELPLWAGPSADGTRPTNTREGSLLSFDNLNFSLLH